MPRPHIPLHIPDLSAFARRLAALHAGHQASTLASDLPPDPTSDLPPGSPDDAQSGDEASLEPQDFPEPESGSCRVSHVQWLNWLAKAAGHRNFQALRAQAPQLDDPSSAVDPWSWPLTPETGDTETPASAVHAALSDNARKALTQFDDSGRLVRWPVKYSVQTHILWMLWTRFDAKRTYTEKEVNAILKDAHTYGDHVTLRRELVNHRLLSRTSDCREYRKCPRRPEPEVQTMLGLWREQHRAVQGASRRPPGQARLASIPVEQQSPPKGRPLAPPIQGEA